jgi:hypothetical protein
MPAEHPLYQEVHAQIKQTAAGSGLRQSSVTRLALLVSGLLEAEAAVPRRMAQAIDRLGLTRAQEVDSIARRVRRCWRDRGLTAARCYHPAVRQLLADPAITQSTKPVILIVDESSHTDRVHLLRVSLAYRGGSLPLTWAIWPQNQALEPGAYGQWIAQVLAEAAALLPAGVDVLVLADRAYGVPSFIDQLAALGWHWIVRVTTTGSLRFQDRHGAEHELAALVARQLPAAGQRWRTRGRLFKGAGWRVAGVVAHWAAGQREPLVVLTDLPPRWGVLDIYDQRFWIEPGFRGDKTAGWRWETCQMSVLDHHGVLLLAMAWATLLALCLGAEAAETRLARVAQRPAKPPTAPRPKRWEHARDSLFSLGRQEIQRRLLQRSTARITWHLPKLHAPRWTTEWETLQAQRYLKTVPP